MSQIFKISIERISYFVILCKFWKENRGVEFQIFIVQEIWYYKSSLINIFKKITCI